MTQTIEPKLLKVIHTLVSCGSVKTTANLLNLSPGAISYSLKKLRDITGEHLFIRTRTGMKPNATALELSQRYESILSTDFEGNSQNHYQDNKTLTILTYSPVEMLLSSSITNLSKEIYPYSYVFLPYTINTNERLNNLVNQDSYIDIGAELPQSKAVSKIKLFTSDISMLAGENNSAISEMLTSNDLHQLKHAIWSSLGDYYCVDMQTSNAVKQYIQKRKVAIVSGSVINMVELCSRSDYIMLIPDVFTPVFTKAFPVKRIELPEELKMKHDCYIHFNNKITENPTMVRLIDDIIRAAKSGFTFQSP